MAVLLFLVIASTSGHCPLDDSCEQMNLPIPQDEIRKRENSAFEGHTLSEHTSPNYYNCFVRCADNCQCLSFNFKTGVNGNCQLIEAASYTNPESIKPKTGWMYIEMVRSYLTKPPWQTCSSDSCHNGCCQSSPCENGGTCQEKCEVKARRFKCACLPGYTGHRCHKTLRSCHDIMLSGRHANGVYQIRNQTNDILNVYCDFGSEPGGAWTLVQSYSLEKGKKYSGKDIFSSKPLFEDFPVNEESPKDWSSYRLSLDNMKSIQSHSTHWRATCEFPTTGIDFRDYIRVQFDDYDVMKEPQSSSDCFECKRCEFINIRGNQCTNCTVLFGICHTAPPFVRSYGSHSLGSCDFDGRTNGVVYAERSFGYYSTVNRAFRCSVSNDSTTQYWFGKI